MYQYGAIYIIIYCYFAVIRGLEIIAIFNKLIHYEMVQSAVKKMLTLMLMSYTNFSNLFWHITSFELLNIFGIYKQTRK